MPINDSRLLELALEALEDKRRNLDEEIKQIRGRLGGRRSVGLSAGAAEAAKPTNGRRKRRGRRMSAAQRKLVSERMKKFWADRKKGKK
jgi:hypothetical protein